MKTYSNRDLLRIVDDTLKGITEYGITEISDMHDAILQPTKFDKFVRRVQDKTVIVPEARYIKMETHRVDIDRIAFIGRILTSLKDTEGNTRELLTSEFAKPSVDTNRLDSQDFQAIASIRDETLRKNIEKGGFEDTLIDLFGEAAGRDLEEFFILADKDMLYSQDKVLSKEDGWVKLAENKVYGVNGPGGNKDFDPAGATYPENMFEAMLDVLPKYYLGSRTDWRFYVTYPVEKAWRKLLKARQTPLGDEFTTKAAPLAYEGIPIVRVPMLERAKEIDKGGPGTVCMLQNPDNMVWGIFLEVGIEREREAKLHRTDFVLTVEADSDYEDENAVVIAYIEKPVPPEVS